MKKCFTLIFVFAAASILARDPGTGSNPTVGPGPSTSDAAPTDTSVMGGGTPGNLGAFHFDIAEPDNQRLKLKKMKQKQEESKDKKKSK